MKSITMLTLSGAIAFAALAGSGCSSKCAQLRKDYDKTVAQEQPFVEPATGDDLPIHLGVAMRDDLLNEVVDRAVRGGLEKALDFGDQVSLKTGQEISIKTDGEVADVGLFPDKACDECLRIDGRLGGSVSVKLPVLGIQTVPLAGAFSIVAPVVFGRTDDGLSAVKLDLAKATELGRSNVDPEINQLPPTWWKLIEAPLSKMLTDAVTKDLPPVTLFTFEAPDLGIEGLEVAPAKLVSDAKRGVVFAGFHTNLNVPEGTSLDVATELGKNHDIAIGAHPAVLSAMGRAMLSAGKLSRTWSKEGKASPQGPIHLGISGFSFSEGEPGSPSPFALDFRAWNLPAEGQCWWGDTRASGTVIAKEGGDLEVSVEKVELVESSMAGIFETVARWKTSSLLSDGAKVVTKTLDPETLEFPGGQLQLGRTTLAASGGSVWMRARATAKDSAEADSAPQ